MIGKEANQAVVAFRAFVSCASRSNAGEAAIRTDMGLRRYVPWGAGAVAAFLLAGCGSIAPVTIDSAAAQGTLIDVSLEKSLDKEGLVELFDKQDITRQLPLLAGAPDCGVDFHYFRYSTEGAKGEPTTASGVLMAPTGGPSCSGPRPVVVYTHGTAATKAYNLAKITDPNNEASLESEMMAAFFASHGYIVVASNYAGYDSSPLPYHPYLNADQQSKDVINALAAARSAMAAGLPSGDSDNGKLFITGNSEGGHVAMATHRAMQDLGMPVTASAPISGPYAMLALGDAVMVYGKVGYSSTVYYPMVLNSYQNAYGNIYQTLADVYSPTYAIWVDGLLPGKYSFDNISDSGRLPDTALFNSVTPGAENEPGTGIPALDAAMGAPGSEISPVRPSGVYMANIWLSGFGRPYLINNSFRRAYAQDAWVNRDGVEPKPTNLLPAANPTFGLRQDLKKNDLRGWQPKAPVLLCGGMNDPDVPYSINTLTMKALWADKIHTGQVQVTDVDPTSNGNPDDAGKVVDLIGAIASRAIDANKGGDPSTIGKHVQDAIISDDAFKPLFGTPDAPVSPQGALVLGMAGIAATTVSEILSYGLNSPDFLHDQVVENIKEYYHFPLVESACLVETKSWFARF